MHRTLSLAATLLLFIGIAAAPCPAHAAASYANCNSFIDSLPTTTSAVGTVCLRSDLTTSGETGGDAIILDREHMVLDCNGHSIEYTGGRSEVRNGIAVYGKRHVTVRNCVVRGFRYGIAVETSHSGIGTHVVEDNVVEGGSYVGIHVDGDGSVVRRNRVADIGGLEGTDYTGIETFGTVDILDNTVHDMTPQDFAAWGITAGDSDGGTIRGNRIRGLSGYYGWGAIGIHVAYSSRVTVSGNDISGTMVQGMYPSVGVLCFNNEDGSSNVRLSENVISGYPTMQLNCVDVGTNDYSL